MATDLNYAAYSMICDALERIEQLESKLADLSVILNHAVVGRWMGKHTANRDDVTTLLRKLIDIVMDKPNPEKVEGVSGTEAMARIKAVREAVWGASGFTDNLNDASEKLTKSEASKHFQENQIKAANAYAERQRAEYLVQLDSKGVTSGSGIAVEDDEFIIRADRFVVKLSGKQE